MYGVTRPVSTQTHHYDLLFEVVNNNLLLYSRENDSSLKFIGKREVVRSVRSSGIEEAVEGILKRSSGKLGQQFTYDVSQFSISGQFHRTCLNFPKFH